MKPDKETQEALEKGSKYYEVVLHEGWDVVRKDLVARIQELNDLSKVPSLEPVLLSAEVEARKKAGKILVAWLESVEGNAQAHKTNQDLLRENGYKI